MQGLCVATLFCFFNGEVIAQVKRKYRTYFFSSRARSNSYTATQVSVSIDLTLFFSLSLSHAHKHKHSSNAEKRMIDTHIFSWPLYDVLLISIRSLDVISSKWLFIPIQFLTDFFFCCCGNMCSINNCTIDLNMPSSWMSNQSFCLSSNYIYSFCERIVCVVVFFFLHTL